MPNYSRWSAAVVVLAMAGPATAWAEPNLPSTPRGPEQSPALGIWQTTVTREAPETALSQITTGSIRPDGPHSSHPKGAPLEGSRHDLNGQASFYFEEQTTASGEHFDRRGLTAAHRTLPFGTRVKVTRADTGQSVVVRINDRGPFKPGRIIDLSEGAARTIGMIGSGVVPVRLDVLGPQ